MFITNTEDIQWQHETLLLYEKASSACLNWVKVEALLLGQWRSMTLPNLPGGLEWGQEGFGDMYIFLAPPGRCLLPSDSGPLPEAWESEGYAQDLNCSEDCAFLDRDL